MSSYPVTAPASESKVKVETASSGVSWSAVLAGGFIGAALALVMIALGSGLGLSAVSPWASSGASGIVIGTSAIFWIVITQAASAGLGGYLAGRLRVRWSDLHVDEIYFRDTAHGLLVWAVGVVVTASVLTSAALSFAGSANSTSAAGNRSEGLATETTKYLVDKLFRSERASSANDMATVKGEAERILSVDMQKGQASAEDQAHLAQLVSASTGMNGTDSTRRVSDVTEQIRAELDKTRRAAAHTLLWIFVSLLTGAFCASFAATVGGRQRDRVSI